MKELFNQTFLSRSNIVFCKETVYIMNIVVFLDSRNQSNKLPEYP